MKLLRAATISTLALISPCSAVNGGASHDGSNATAAWQSMGCYTDNVSGRALSHGMEVSGGGTAMTNEACQNACQSAGYSMAGTEYGGECWCDNEIGNSNGPAPDGQAKCDMKCNGNATETCGGANRLTLYRRGSDGGGSAGKRGLAYNNNNPGKNAEYANLFKGHDKISWGYDWGFPSWGLDASFEFVPMLWGKPSGPAPDWIAAAQAPETRHVLGFNEPDLTYSGSSNMLPAAAAAGYLAYLAQPPLRPDVRIGMPNVLWNNDRGSSSGGSYNSRTWTEYFVGNCTGCRLDFAAIHYYQDCVPAGAGAEEGAAWFRGNVTDAHEALGRPVWVTEFQCYGTEEQQVGFLGRVLPWLDAQGWVERYAYFGAFQGLLVGQNGTGLSALGQAYATI